MHGDFSRDSFDSRNNFTRVLMQQGRLIVDADWNEQSAITLNYLRTLAADIIGWHGGADVVKAAAAAGGNPAIESSGPFVVALDNGKAAYNPGRYYVDGLLCENEQRSMEDPTKWPHPTTTNDDAADPIPKNLLVYLDVWQRFLTAAVDPDHLRDPGLPGLDTCGRDQTICAVRVVKASIQEGDLKLTDRTQFRTLQFAVKTPNGDVPTSIGSREPKRDVKLPHLIAWTNLASGDTGACAEKADSGYTGLENQLYRVEVHHAGVNGITFWDGPLLDPETKDPKGAFTLKWSRDNGSVVYAATAGNGTATLKLKMCDDTRAIHPGDYVELIPLTSDFGSIVSVKSVREDNGTVSIDFNDKPAAPVFNKDEPILLRRWDHQSRKDFPVSADGGFLVAKESDENEPLKKWFKTNNITDFGQGASVPIPLEDGVVVRIWLPTGCILQAGDYWLIPARAATSDIIWPPAGEHHSPDSFQPVPTRYTEHHYAPIALIKSNGDIVDLRRKITPIARE